MLIVQRPTIESEPVNDDRSRFIVQPLEPGFGYTLGNTLRRTLLARIPGAAITSVRIEGVQHEFSTMEGVVEDVVDFILNLKQVVLRMETDSATMYLSAKGKADVSAGDLKVPAGVEVVNGDLHLASLSSAGRLEVELTADRGVGYRSADRNRTGDKIGIIPIDAIFSPVRKVAFKVESTQVGMMTDFDRLVIDVETDGSVTPSEAVSSAGKTLRELFGLFADVDEYEGLPLGDVVQPDMGSPDLELPIEALDLTERPRNCLRPRPDPQRGRAGGEDRGRPAQHHQLRAEEPRRGGCQARRAGAVAARRERHGRRDGLMPTPKKGPRLGGSPSHQRKILANLATSLIVEERLTTTEAKAKLLRPYVEKIITKARRGDLHARRTVMRRITDQEVVTKLFDDIAPRYADRPGGYTRVVKLGPRRGDGAEMAVIELV